MPLSDELQIDVNAAVAQDDPRWQVVERIVSSTCFQRSERLKALLKHVAAQYLAGHPERLTGHQIGQAVFGKTAQDTSEDNTVRIHARQLRLRLLEYFDTYGRDEPYIIEIPKGSYVPVFRPAHPVESAPEIAVIETREDAKTTESATRTGSRREYLPWSIAGLLAAAVVAMAILWPKTPVRATPYDAFEAWPLSEFAAPDRQTQIVLCDNSFAMFEVAAGNHHYSLSDYLKPDYPHNIQIAPGIQDPGIEGLLDQLGRKQITSYADSAAAARIERLNLPGSWVTRPARDVKLREVQEGNYIFFGSSWANPWVELYEPRLNYVLTTTTPLGILNRHPGAGEPNEYLSQGRTGSFGDDYAAVALIPNEKRGLVMIVQGTKEEGTEAAGSFITDPHGRSALREQLQLKPSDVGHIYFEALLRTKTYGGASAQTELVAARRVSGHDFAAAQPR